MVEGNSSFILGVAAQLAAVILTMLACRRALLRDHYGMLSLGRLMKTVTEKLGGNSIASGKELAREWGDVKLIYGTRSVDGGVYEADLWVNVEPKFPDGSYR